MSHLIAVGFDNPSRAEEVRLDLMRLQRNYLIDLEDAVVAIRDDDGQVKLRQLYNLTAAGAMSGGFWGTLIGLIFLSPLLGLVVGGTTGAVMGALSDVGVNDDFMKQLAKQLKPGSSALFVLVRQATPDKVLAELENYEGTVLQTSLTKEDEETLRRALSSVHSDAPTQCTVEYAETTH